jgi:hypothetical protein
MRSAEGAIDWMIDQNRRGTTGWQGWCLRASRTAWGLPGGWNSANDWWAAVPPEHKHPWSPNPPLGAPVFWAGGNHGHIELSDNRGGIWGTDSPVRDRIGNVDINWPRDRWGFRNVGWASWLNGRVLPLDMSGGGSNPGAPTTPDPQEVQMDYAEVTRSAAQRVGSEWAWLTFNRDVRNTSGVHWQNGIFSMASRRWDIDLSLSLVVPSGRANRVSVQALVVDGNNNVSVAYPVQSFDVGDGLVSARFAGLSGFCSANRRVRIRARALDAACDIMPYAVCKRFA